VTHAIAPKKWKAVINPLFSRPAKRWNVAPPNRNHRGIALRGNAAIAPGQTSHPSNNESNKILEPLGKQTGADSVKQNAARHSAIHAGMLTVLFPSPHVKFPRCGHEMKWIDPNLTCWERAKLGSPRTLRWSRWSISHRIHGAGIYANIGGILMGSMLPYIAYMDPMGMALSPGTHGYPKPSMDQSAQSSPRTLRSRLRHPVAPQLKNTTGLGALFMTPRGFQRAPVWAALSWELNLGNDWRILDPNPWYGSLKLLKPS
jgi:hypothetical protein